jgi:hypothetical protein
MPSVKADLIAAKLGEANTAIIAGLIPFNEPVILPFTDISGHALNGDVLSSGEKHRPHHGRISGGAALRIGKGNQPGKPEP